MFTDFPDAAILEQFLNYTDVFDPSITELVDADQPPELSSKPPAIVHDEAFVFKSPSAWVADWSVKNLRNDRRHAEVVEQRVFNLPRTSEIATLVRLYFSHAHHRLPVLNERYFYRLTDQRHSNGTGRSLEPISLALLYAIMFFACSYLRTENTDASYVRAIRSMRCEYYSRAATLFKLGCESDSLRQIQICLLLSTHRNYPGQFYENERWIIKAYRTLQDAGALPSKNSGSGFVEEPDWKRACACWLHRSASSPLGLKWTNSPDLMEASCFPWHQISLADFQEDFSFSWHLSAGVKRQLTQIFVNRIDLDLHFCQLSKILWKRTASEMIAIGESLAITQGPPFDALPIEEIEVRLQKWKLDHSSMFSMEAPVSATQLEQRLLRAEQTLLKLKYGYVLVATPIRQQQTPVSAYGSSAYCRRYDMCCLYQNTLFIDRPLITEWAAAMIRSSRAALWNSIDSIRQTLQEALDEKLILLLPLNMIVQDEFHSRCNAKLFDGRLLVVFAPLTVSSLYMQKVRVFDASAIENLATCSKVAKTMIELHDGADFYATILSNTLSLADKYKATSRSNEPEVTQIGFDSTVSPTQSDAEKILPEAQLHSLVMRFHTLAVALGRMPKIDTILPKAGSPEKATLRAAS